MNKAQKATFDAIISEYENSNRNDGFFAFVDETWNMLHMLINTNADSINKTNVYY